MPTCCIFGIHVVSGLLKVKLKNSQVCPLHRNLLPVLRRNTVFSAQIALIAIWCLPGSPCSTKGVGGIPRPVPASQSDIATTSSRNAATQQGTVTILAGKHLMTLDKPKLESIFYFAEPTVDEVALVAFRRGVTRNYAKDESHDF